MITVKLPTGEYYNVKTLLADGDSNAKLSKSDKSGKGYLTFGMSLAPANVSGYQVCASSSPGCRAACLYTSGHGKAKTVQTARIAKTIAFFEHREQFRNMLELELLAANRKAKKQDKIAAVRLNVVSDVMWEKQFPGILQTYNDIQFYDYTKHYKRMLDYCRDGMFVDNYHLTFSRSEENEQQCLSILESGGNAAVFAGVKGEDCHATAGFEAPRQLVEKAVE